MKSRITIFASLMFALVYLAGCEPELPSVNPPDEPADTIPQSPTDSTIVQPVVVDTLSIDTVRVDTVIDRMNDQVVVAYVTHYGKKLPDPQIVTNINYGFAELYVRDGVYQRFGLQGSQKRFEKVVALKQENPNLRIQLSFTHTVSNSDNYQDGGFSAMCKSESQRAHFCHDCRVFCDTWGIDGIDIDWEFPGVSWSGHACDPLVDVGNFTLLMKQLRDTLGNERLLTYAAYVMQPIKVEGGGLKYIDNLAVEPYVDWINIMAYDLTSAPQPHNAMICDGYFDINRCYNSYRNAKYPMHKLVLGIPFYGRHTFDDGEYTYQMIMSWERYPTMFPGYKVDNWNDTWKVPYVTLNGEFFCSYDNPRSIALKGEWVFEKDWRGLMYWENSDDDTKNTLAHACWDSQKTQQVTYETYIYHLSNDSTIIVGPIMIQ